jgi:murein DD-endopeptidase MepM/ murein hydrolase activator NlpD
MLEKKNHKKQNIITRILTLIEAIIEHKIFKPISISIIISFILFNGFFYLKSYLEDKTSFKIINSNQLIKINIPDSFNDDKHYVVHRTIKVGDTLLNILIDIGASDSDIFNIISTIKKVYDPKLIKAGDQFTIKYQNHHNSDASKKVAIYSINFNSSVETEIEIIGTKNVAGNYSYDFKKTTKALTKQVLKYAVTIKNGLYVDGTDSGISPNIMINMINLYSFDVDFQRDIREGDEFELLFESFYDDKGNRVKDGDVLFSSINLQRKRTIDMYLNGTEGKGEYFDTKGNSVKKSLLKTPINGARISSRFGARKHPILGYTRMHKGIDFAAPRGTPIFAAGSGTITHYGVNGGYGNFVKIRHNTQYSTAYAHASRFARSFRVGSKVKQGDVIAYVGTTGRSTGPHLHYEIIFKGKHINPSKVKSMSGTKLVGRKLKEFLVNKNQIDNLLKTIPNQNKL